MFFELLFRPYAYLAVRVVVHSDLDFEDLTQRDILRVRFSRNCSNKMKRILLQYYQYPSLVFYFCVFDLYLAGGINTNISSLAGIN